MTSAAQPSPTEIESFDVLNDQMSRFDGLIDLLQVIDNETDPTHPTRNAAWYRNRMFQTEVFQQRMLVAIREDRVVGYSWIFLAHEPTNANKAEVTMAVHPDVRRSGIGTTLLHSTLDVLDRENRTSLLTFNPLGEPSRGFWAASGSKLGMDERESRLRVQDINQQLLDDWITRADERAPEYQTIRYRGPCPQELIPALIKLRNATNDAPQDGLDWADHLWSEQDLRNEEETVALRNVEMWSVMVLGPDGDPAGLTQLDISNDLPQSAVQGWTVVRDTHRNRGIGRLLKATMTKWLLAVSPEVLTIDTENAESNQAMLHINEALGFRPTISWGIWQQDVSVLRGTVRSDE